MYENYYNEFIVNLVNRLPEKKSSNITNIIDFIIAMMSDDRKIN